MTAKRKEHQTDQSTPDNGQEHTIPAPVEPRTELQEEDLETVAGGGEDPTSGGGGGGGFGGGGAGREW